MSKDFRSFLLDLLPKSAHKHVDAIVAEHVEWLEQPLESAEVKDAHIAVERREIGAWTIGIDAVGNPVSVDFGTDEVTAS